jgi:hypothetical protein
MPAPRMDAFTRAYFEAALWATNDESDDQGGEPLDKNYSNGDIADATRDKMIADCADFQARFANLLEDDDSPAIEKWGRDELAGHDFWLTRNGHGAGFWDGNWPKNGDALTEAAKEYGEFDLYVGDDGEIHGSPLDRAPRAREARGPHVRAPHRVRGTSFTPTLSGSYVGRRVEILKVDWDSPNAYFKPGQFGYVVGQNTSGGMHFVDGHGTSKPGEVALLIAKTREMRGGALWFSLKGVRFTGRHQARR